ncbi:hypothetical protein SAMN05216338_104740 [Bradyrhizobium sp. Rc2d]|nr:hypothetical protein SAMN05216338_104740 [Bradyrhizobium sp. Rc2d]
MIKMVKVGTLARATSIAPREATGSPAGFGRRHSSLRHSRGAAAITIVYRLYGGT